MKLAFKTLIRLNLSLLILTQLFSCAILQDSSTNAPVKDLKYKYTALGYASIAMQHGNNHQQKMLNAIKASKMDAYLELSEYINGILMDSSSNMDNMKLRSGPIKTRTHGLVKGAKVTKTYHEGDLYITELEIEMSLSPNTSSKESVYYKGRKSNENGNQISF